MAWVASACVACHARLRHDECRPAPCQPSAPKKSEPDASGRVLIRWSVQEIRRIAMRLAQRRIEPAHIIAWSLWRRAHQAAAREAHLKRRASDARVRPRAKSSDTGHQSTRRKMQL